MNDSYIIPLLVAGSILIPLFMFYITTFVIISKNKQRKSEAEKKQMEFQYEKQLLQTMLEVQEKAMNQISQEIHDNIGQVLAGVQMNLISLSAGMVTERDRMVRDTKDQVSQALKDLRNLSRVLNSKYINKIGLEESLRKETQYLGTYNKIQFEIDVEEGDRSLPPERELMVFRIAQESLSNIIKHAAAANVRIVLGYLPSGFSMMITDDGKGFDQEDSDSAGIGLMNMKQRVEVMSGSFNITSAPGTGTTITIHIPYE